MMKFLDALLKVLMIGGLLYAVYTILSSFIYRCQNDFGKFIKTMLKQLFLFALGGFIYYNIEILYRGYSHFSMFIVGGLCFVIMGLVNEVFKWDLFLEFQILLGWIAVLALEFISGCIVNLWLGWHVWDYSKMPYNLLGQISLAFALLWIPLVLVGIVVDDVVRWLFLKEDKPRYRSCLVESVKAIFKKK